jgi:YbbR domain-containing protein
MRPALFDSLGLKLVSLVLGFSLWYIVAGGEGTELVLPVPLEFRNVPEGMEVIEESVQQVDIRLSGSSEILRRLTPREIQAGVDLSGAQAGEHTIYLSPENVASPFGARVMRVTPASVNFQLDQTDNRRLHVVPRVIGAPASGFELANIWLDSVEVEVMGPASRLKDLEQVTTQPISVEGLREPYTQTVQVMLDDPYVRPVDPRGVEVTLDVREERIRRKLADLLVTSYPPAANTSITPDSVRIEVEGPRSLVEGLTGGDIELRVAVEDLEPGLYQLTPEAIFLREELSGITVLSLDPAQVRVRVRPKENK